MVVSEKAIRFMVRWGANWFSGGLLDLLLFQSTTVSLRNIQLITQ